VSPGDNAHRDDLFVDARSAIEIHSRNRREPSEAPSEPDDEVMDLRSRLAASEARFEAIVERSSDGVLVVDNEGAIRFANAAAAAMLARSRNELIDHPVGFAVLAGDVTQVELLRPGGHLIFAEMRVVDTGWEGQPCRLALLRDVTERRQAEAELAQRATHDHLTRLPNRFLLNDRVLQALARLKRTHTSLAVFVLDLDEFKAVNDDFGHLAGDEVLVEAARRIEETLRPADSAARFGGDEFVLVCEAMTRAEAKALAARLTAAFDEPMLVTGHSINVSVSVGYTVATDPKATPESLIDAADKSMYRVKRGEQSSATRRSQS
jgi:diguanylate cyclase (GGDEF)-like protein